MPEAQLTEAPATASLDADTRNSAAERDESQATAATVTIHAKADELYAFWRDFSRLAPIMENVESIETHDSTRSTWTVKAPGGRTVSWDAVVTEDRPGQSIAWQSVDGADIRNSGRVEFRDAGTRGTVVRAVIAYDPPAGIIGELVAKLFQREPAIQARRELRRFKQHIETGEVATSARTRAHAAQHKAG